MLSNLLENGGKYIEKCNFYIKYFDKIKCYADRPYLVFSELKPETHIFFFWPKWCIKMRYMSEVLVRKRKANLKQFNDFRDIVQLPNHISDLTFQFEKHLIIPI